MHDRRAPDDRPTRDGSAFAPVAVTGHGSAILPGIVLATGLAFVLAFVKPWGGGGAGPTPLVQAPATRTPVISPSRVPDAAAVAAAAQAAEMGHMCVGTNAWLVASEEQISDRGIRIWRALEPVVAVQPDDPAIPWVVVASGSIGALGWCGPQFGPGRLVDPTIVEAWTVSGTRLRTLALLRLHPTGTPSSLGGLYRPAFEPPPADPASAWPAGRYLFRVRSGDGRVFTFGVEVELVPSTRTPGVTRAGATDAAT